MRRTATLYQQVGRAAIIGIVILPFLYALARADYLLFHVVVESTTAIVAGSIFVIAWNTRRIAANGYLLALGIGSLFVMVVALLHAFAYRGMGVFPGYDANLPTQLWIVSRFLLAGAFFFAALSMRRNRNPIWLFVGFGAATTAALVSIFGFGNFPAMFVEGRGLTPLKIASEYVVAAVFALSAWLVWRRRDELGAAVASTLVTACSLMAAAEIAFTTYTDPFGITNMLGHFFVVLGFVFTYLATIQATLRDPYSTLFQELARREKAERHIAESLQTALMTVPDTVAGFSVGEAYLSATAEASVGGDFWDLFSPRPGYLVFTVGDVCGKGIEVAATAAVVRTTVRGLAHDDPDPCTVLTRANDTLSTRMDPDKFATIVIGLVEIATGQTVIASAGHPAPVLFRPGTGASVVEVAPNPPLCVGLEISYECNYLQIARGSELVVYSDGLSEAGRSPMFGTSGIVRALDAANVRRPAETAQYLLDSAVQFAQGDISDDVMIVVLRYDGPPEDGLA